MPTDTYWKDPDVGKKWSFAEGTTGPPCSLLLQQAGLPPSTEDVELVILDQACGTGITSQLLSEALGEEEMKKATLKCGDFSESMVAVAKDRMDRLGWGERGSAEVINAMDTKLPSDHFTHVIMNFGINVLPDSNAALKECIRLLRPNGTLALTSWSYLGWVEPVTSALATIPSCPPLPTSSEYLSKTQSAPWHEIPYIRSTLMSEMDLDPASIQITEHRTQSTAESAQIWAAGINAFLGVVLKQLLGPEEVQRLTGNNESLERLLREYMEKQYGKGKIELEMGAIVTTAKKRA